MPNRCFIHTEAALSPAVVEQDIKDIVRNKFRNLFKVETHIVKNEICDWLIIFDEVYAFPICLRAQNKIEFEHPNNYFLLWMQLVVEDELAIKYKAKMTDEEFPQSNIQPDPEHHKTFKTFLETIMAYHSPEWRKAIIGIELSFLPIELKTL